MTTETKAVEPEARFWRRYSPHGEAPLSLAGSAGVHLMVGGALVLFGAYAAALFAKAPTTPPEVGLVGVAPGPPAPGDEAKVAGRGGPPEEMPFTPLPREKEPPRPPLSRPELDRIQSVLALPSVDPERLPRNAPSLADLSKKIRDRLRPTGPVAAASPTGPVATRKRTPREDRMLRWHLRFSADSAKQYVEQLKALGAILAFPVGAEKDAKFKVVRDLGEEAKLVDDELAGIDRIYWI